MVKRVSAKTVPKIVKRPAAKKVTAKKAAAPIAAAPPVARKTPAQWTDDSRELFLTTLAETANVAMAARAADMSRTAVYAERKRNTDFAQSWKLAMDMALDDLEMAVFERATHGYDKDVVYQGEKTDKVRLYSDALAMFLLRAHRPEIYGKSSPEGVPSSANVEDVRTMIEAKIAALKEDAI
jgi:hypothetical protein